MVHNGYNYHRIRALREDRDLTQKKVAEILNIGSMSSF